MNVFELLAQASPADFATMLGMVANVRSTTPAAVQADFAAWKVERAAAAEKAAATEKAKAARAMRANLAKESESLSLSDEALPNFLQRATAAGMTVRLSADGKISVGGGGGTKTAVALGMRGRGRPAKDAPSPFVDANGDRILGALTDFVKAGIPEATWAEHNLLRQNGSLKAGAALATALIKAGFIKEG